jgi:hypothetical protein
MDLHLYNTVRYDTTHHDMWCFKLFGEDFVVEM